MRRSTIVITVVGVLGVTILWWIVVVGGVDERIADAEAIAGDLTLQQATLEQQLLVLEDAAQSGSEYGRALQTIETSIPNEPELDVFIETLKAKADQRGVRLVAIGISEPRSSVDEPAADVLVIDLDLAVEAQFWEMLGFLTDLEDLDRLVVIDSISVNPSGGGNPDSATFEQDLLSITLTAALYTKTSPLVAVAEPEEDN